MMSLYHATGNIHAAHAQQFLGAAATPMAPYGYAYYSPNVLQGSFPVFTAPPTQVRCFAALFI